MTASPFSSAPVATTNCLDEPFAASSGWWFLLASATAYTAEVAPRSLGRISKGGPARNRAVFINLGGECAKEGVRACEPDFADLALCFTFPVSVSLEGQMTPFRCLLLMKTTRFLAGLPDICAHLEIGGARDKSPDPCLIARALLRRPLATNPHLAYRSAYGNRSAGACPAACCGVCRGGSRLVPHSHPCLSLCTIPVEKHWASVHDTPPTALA